MGVSNLTVLAWEMTDLGLLCLRKRRLLGAPGVEVTEITLGREFLMGSYKNTSERALASLALETQQGEGLDVLVGGMGLGHTAHEVLKSDRVARVEVVEYLPQVITWLRCGWLPLSGELTADVRLVTVEGDIYAVLSKPAERRRHAILIDVDHAPDAPLARCNQPFYTAEGLARAKAHLAPGGVLAVWSSADNAPFRESLADRFNHASANPVTYRNALVDAVETDWVFVAHD